MAEGAQAVVSALDCLAAALERTKAGEWLAPEEVAELAEQVGPALAARVGGIPPDVAQQVLALAEEGAGC